MRFRLACWLGVLLAVRLGGAPGPLCEAELKRLPPQPPSGFPAPPPQSCEGVDELISAATKNCAAQVAELLNAGASPTQEDEEGRTPLSEAAWFGSTDAARLLLDAGADPTRLVRGRSALCWGARSSELSRLFLERGLLDRLEDSCSYLARYSSWGSADLTRRLIAFGLDLERPDDHGRTPLTNAIVHRNYPVIHALLEAGAKTDGLLGFGSDPTTTCLLLQYGADPNDPDERGETPLMTAAALGEDVWALHLLEGGADPNLQDARGRTALMHSLTGPLQLQHSYVTLASKAIVAEVLLKHGADVNVRDAAGRSALDYAVTNGYGRLAIALKEEMRQDGVP